MSFEHIIRETQQMQRLLNSFSVASHISEAMKVTNSIPQFDMSVVNSVNEQYSSALKATQLTIPPDLLKLAIDFSRINAALQPSIDFANAFKVFNTPLPLVQTEFLQRITLPTVNFSTQLKRLSREARILGEFESEDTETEEPTEQSELQESIQQRFKTVRFLPIKLMDAIAANPDLMHGLDPQNFERLVADLLNSLEFENIVLTPRSSDGGRDILATKFVSGIPLLFSFECKRYKNKIGLDIMRGLLGSVAHSATKVNIGVLVTTSTFTSGASEFVLSEPLIDGKDFYDLVKWINSYKSQHP